MPFFKYVYPARRLKRKNSKSRKGPKTASLAGELADIVEAETAPGDVDARKRMKTELDSFGRLHERYLAGLGSKSLDWEKISAPDVISLDALPTPSSTQVLSKLAVLKFNGGLGTSMGMTGAKSALVVKDGQTFLDLTIQQIHHLNKTHVAGVNTSKTVTDGTSECTPTPTSTHRDGPKPGVDVPLLLMTSIHTEQDTMRVVTQYANRPEGVRITSFNQSRYPRVFGDTHLPVRGGGGGGGGGHGHGGNHATSSSSSSRDDGAGKLKTGAHARQWYPPGHGDLYASLKHSGLLDKLLRDGREYLFVSNSDNLGATVDVRILQHMMDAKVEFVMEVTGKTKADIKGGTLVDYEGSLRLIEFSQVEPDHVDDFQSVKKFGVFNTNNLWIYLPALKRLLEHGDLELDVIPTLNLKPHASGRSLLELETTAGSAIKFFAHAEGISVPRSRYLPVKNCSDLLLMQSDIYDFEDGHAKVRPRRMFDTTPVIKLGDRFKNIHEFQERLKYIPHISDLDHLTVAGDVHLGRDVTLRGTVIIVAKDGERIDIPDGSVMENRLVSGNLISIVRRNFKQL